MKNAFCPLYRHLALPLVFTSFLFAASAQDLPPGAVWVYNLIEGSRLIDDCPVCDRLPIVRPIRGTFELRFVQADPLFTTYNIENLWFTNSAPTGPKYTVAGSGTVRIGGEIAVFQYVWLEVYIDNGITNSLCLLATNGAFVSRRWPMLQISLEQTNGNFVQQYHLDLNAAPLREIWFSTANDFTAGAWPPPDNVVGNGDLLSSKGGRVKTNSALTAKLGVMPPVPDLGLKDFDLRPGGEIVFSIETDTFSESLGRALHSGDLLSSVGRIVQTNLALISAFQPDPVPADGVGVSALKFMDSTEIWFSVQTNFYSKTLGATVTSGDLLSDSGQIVRRNADLLRAFRPADTNFDAGLKAISAWQNGEIWFCTAAGFDSTDGTHYDAGDLLSDWGYVVYRNAELLSMFAPTDAPSLNPLDALWVVTDAQPDSPAPQLESPQLTNEPPASLAFSWRALGKVFLLEKATNVSGPYGPLNPISPDTIGIDPGILTNGTSGFYRLRQW